ncbi:MAG: MarR family transcriptional regulator [Candidatus Hodarchaeota archaeon]
MPDILFIGDLVARATFLGCFLILFISQLFQMTKRPTNPKFLLIAMGMGVIAFILLFIEAILWEMDPIDENRAINYIFAFIFLQFYAYFWYLHYESIVNVILPRNRILMSLPILLLNGTAACLHFLGINLGGAQLVARIALLTWLLLCGLIIAVILTNDLLELKKIPPSELGAIVIQSAGAAFLLIETFFSTVGAYDKSASSLLVTLGICVFFIGIFSLLATYLLLNPSHIQFPSLQHDYYSKMQGAFVDQKAKIAAQIDEFVATTATELVPKKLPSTAIFILIYILNSEDFTSYAKSIETDLNLGKSTVSYNLNLLEKEGLIVRRIVSLQDDQRVKAVKVVEKGIMFLFSFYLQLERQFRPSQRLGSFFMKEYAEELVDEALNVVLDGFAFAKKPLLESLTTENLLDDAVPIKPTQILSPKKIFDLPHHLQGTALGVITLQEGTLEEITTESGLDLDRTRRDLNQLRGLGFVGVKLKGGKITYFCSV